MRRNFSRGEDRVGILSATNRSSLMVRATGLLQAFWIGTIEDALDYYDLLSHATSSSGYSSLGIGT